MLAAGIACVPCVSCSCPGHCLARQHGPGTMLDFMLYTRQSIVTAVLPCGMTHIIHTMPFPLLPCAHFTTDGLRHNMACNSAQMLASILYRI